MPYLGDYLGHLLSEITIARMRADIEAVRVAELYADHPLLRHMPVPRFRMPAVDLEVPVVVNKVEPSGPDDSAQGTAAISKALKVFEKVMSSVLSEERIQLTPALKKKIKTALDKKALGLSRPSEISIDIHRVGIEFSDIAVDAVVRVVEPEKRAVFEEKLKDAVRVEFMKLRQKPPRLKVLVTTPEIREAGPKEVITRLHLKISEEAFEWTTIDSEEGKTDRLVIE